MRRGTLIRIIYGIDGLLKSGFFRGHQNDTHKLYEWIVLSDNSIQHNSYLKKSSIPQIYVGMAIYKLKFELKNYHLFIKLYLK